MLIITTYASQHAEYLTQKYLIAVQWLKMTIKLKRNKYYRHGSKRAQKLFVIIKKHDSCYCQFEK